MSEVDRWSSEVLDKARRFVISDRRKVAQLALALNRVLGEKQDDSGIDDSSDVASGGGH